MIVFIDSDYKCHVTDDGTMTAVETDFFNGKCDEFIEGYRFVPDGMTWAREDGEVFHGEMVAPWKDSVLLNAFQAQYESLMEELADMKAALEELGVSVNG